LFAGISPELQKAIDIISEDELADSLAFMNKEKCMLVVLSAMKTYQRIKMKNLDGALI
jgi:hypothetical protein